MVGEPTAQEPRLKEFLEELLQEVSDPAHRRLIQAYGGEDPVRSMEAELGRILTEVIADEN